MRNTAEKDMDIFSKINHCIIEELLVDIYFNFGYSPKQRNLFTESYGLCDKDHGKILKFHRVYWLGMAIWESDKTFSIPDKLVSIFENQWKGWIGIRDKK